MRVDEYLEMPLPVGEVLDFVEEQHPGVGTSVCLPELMGYLFDREPRAKRLVERDVADVLWFVPATVQKVGDHVVQQHCLADATRTHEDDGSADVGPGHQMLEPLEVRTSLHACVVVAYAGTLPPWVFGPQATTHLICGNATHASRLSTQFPEIN